MRRPLSRPLTAAFLAAYLSVAPSGAAPDAPQAEPLLAPSLGQAFELLPPSQTGVDFVNPIDIQHPLKRLYVNAFASGGVAIGDLDGDGRNDLFLTSGPRPNKLYLNSGEMRFQDATADAGVAADANWSAGVALGDVDGDGDLDAYVCSYDAPNLLFLNEGRDAAGKLRFREAAKEFGLDLSDASLMATFCDYDRDGDLDVLVLCYEFKPDGGMPADPPVYQKDGKYFVQPEFEKFYDIKINEFGKPAFANAGRPNYLLRNEGPDASGQVRFRDVSAAAGITGRGFTNSATWWDYNGDGWMDLYEGNDFRDPDKLYHNNGDGTFTDVIRQVAPHTSWFSMGADAGDVNNDGRLDFLIADMAGTTHYASKATMGEMGKFRQFLLTAEPRQYMRNTLFLANGTPRLMEAAFMAGVASTDWTWAIKFGDYDSDALLDVYITNGVARSFNDSDNAMGTKQQQQMTAWEYWEKFPPRKEVNVAFHNEGGLKFKSAGAEWGLDHLGMTYAAATGDLDGDGDPDLVTANLDEQVFVYRNHLGAEASRLRVRLRGAGGNTRAIGAKVTLAAGGIVQARQLMPTTGFVSCNEHELHFGLGAAARAEALRIEWPSGRVDLYENLAAGQLYTFTETETPPAKAAPARLPAAGEPGPQPLFAYAQRMPGVVHHEQDFDDYARQPLLPYKHSELGPGLAFGDIDGDGDEDAYHGGARGEAGRLLENRDGVFTPKTCAAIAAHADREDMGVLFFDADRDADLDLFVVSGSVECAPGDPVLADRLYLNDGKGNFTDASAALPDRRDSGSCVSAADFDRDGDLDLFVGGRVVPGAYPETPRSTLLLNDSSPGAPRFTDATAALAPELEAAGLVTAALWSDADGDGWLDLLVACEWGPIRLFRNDSGAGDKPGRRLGDATAAAGLDRTVGWWNSLASRDFDGDGDLDYVAGNFGLNTQYKAAPDKPELLFYGDMDGSGAKNIIEAKFEGKTLYPRRGLSCSSNAMPFIRQKLGTFHKFASSTLEEVYPENRLESALRLEATELQSSILLNDGKGRFTPRPLPRLAQIAPGFGVLATDFDADGFSDLFLAHNFFAPQPETGRMDGGLSLLLRGTGDGSFVPVGPRLSGLVALGDAKGAAATDFNSDGRMDLAVATNNGAVYTFENRIATGNPFSVRLRGPAGNPAAAGARVTVRGEAIPAQTAEVHTGSGYLSQSSPTLAFGAGKAGALRSVEVIWPDGQTSRHEIEAGAASLVLESPPPK